MFMRSGYSAHTRSSGTENHHRAAHVIVGGIDEPAPGHPQPHTPRLVLEPMRAEAIQTDAVLLHGALAVGHHPFAPALEHESLLVSANCGRLAEVHRAL